MGLCQRQHQVAVPMYCCNRQLPTDEAVDEAHGTESRIGTAPKGNTQKLQPLLLVLLRLSFGRRQLRLPRHRRVSRSWSDGEATRRLLASCCVHVQEKPRCDRETMTRAFDQVEDWPV